MTFLKLFHFSQGKYIWKPKYIIQITRTDWVFSSLKCRQSHCPWAFSSWNRDIQHKLGQCPGCWHPGFLWTSAKASATMIWSMRVKRILHEEVFQLHASCYCYHWILWQSNCRVTWFWSHIDYRKSTKCCKHIHLGQIFILASVITVTYSSVRMSQTTGNLTFYSFFGLTTRITKKLDTTGDPFTDID